MSYPKTYRALRRSAAPYPLTLEFTTESLPETLNPKDVVLRIHAASLNYRDVAMLREGKCVPPFHLLAYTDTNPRSQPADIPSPSTSARSKAAAARRR
jgi:NADPH:quinone reductase-like Zn-dependent oxidoreductase